jgi:hypothetical protein
MVIDPIDERLSEPLTASYGSPRRPVSHLHLTLSNSTLRHQIAFEQSQD